MIFLNLVKHKEVENVAVAWAIVGIEIIAFDAPILGLVVRAVKLVFELLVIKGLS